MGADWPRTAGASGEASWGLSPKAQVLSGACAPAGWGSATFSLSSLCAEVLQFCLSKLRCRVGWYRFQTLSWDPGEWGAGWGSAGLWPSLLHS